MSEDPESGASVTQLMEVHGYDVKRGWEGAEHIAAWDPSRVLAECDAKRQTIEQYLTGQVDETATKMWQAMQRAERSVLLEVLRRWGAVYAQSGRPGYREEWAP